MEKLLIESISRVEADMALVRQLIADDASGDAASFMEWIAMNVANINQYMRQRQKMQERANDEAKI